MTPFRRRARLTITCDDLGMHSTVNEAIVEILEKGLVRSASLMAVGAHFEDAVGRLRASGIHRVGVHLSLAGEFPRLPNRPVRSAHDVPSLVDGHGYLHGSIEAAHAHLDLGEARDELRAQVARVRDAGFTVTHVDGHMFFHERSEGGGALEEVTLDIGREEGVPVRVRGTLRDGSPDTVFIWESHPDLESRHRFYDEFLRSYTGDSVELLIHPGKDLAALGEFTAAGSRRVADHRYFLALTREQLDEREITITGRGENGARE